MLKTLATISHIEYSPSGTVTFVRFRPKEKFTFEEWQFVMIESTFDHPELGKPLKKPYSIATTNDELQTEGTVGVIVKKTVDGFMSEYLTKWIHVGDTVTLTGPLGHMKDSGEHAKYLLISTGSGVSPMVSLYTQLRKNENNIIVNIFGERYHRHILPSVEKLFSESNEKRKNILFLSQEEDIDSISGAAPYRAWHVQLALDEALQTLHDKDMTIFICWTPVMVDDVRQMLTERWFSKEQMKFEKY